MAAVAAAVVVLPTPPEPQVITISLAANSCSSVPGLGRRPPPAPGPVGGVARATSVPELRAEGLGHGCAWRARRGSRVNRYGHVEQRQVAAAARSRSRVRCSARVRRRVTASWAASSTGADRAAHERRQRRGHAPGSRRRVEDLLLAPAEQLGQHLVHDHRGEVRRRSRSRSRSASSSVSVTGISSGAATMTAAGDRPGR